MAHDYNISDFGLKLIKAYEGFRPVETVLVSGQRVIGYGHEYVPGEVSVVTKKKAADLLKVDLEPFEDMVNHNVFAPLSQSQFDALVSLSFNIGAEAFLNSSVVHNLNNGQPLAAAAGFDEWRKSIVIDQTYVVDALVRRRTAEKALFLNPATGVVAAPRNEVPPLHDSTARSGNDDIEMFDKSDARGYVDQTPYATEAVPQRRREDGPSGILTLSERVSESPVYEETLDEDVQVEKPVIDASIEGDVELEPEIKADVKLSPIALAAVEVSERLDNLMEDSAETPIQEMPIIETQEPDLLFVGNGVISDDIIISDEIEVVDKDASKEITENPIQGHKILDAVQDDEVNGIGAYWTALMVGALLLGGGLWKLKFSPVAKLDEMSAFLAPVAMLVGAMMLLGGFYYLIKAELRGTTS